jgi:acyl-CoA thioesterase YciA
MANEIARSRVVTVAVESINFIKPVHVGDVVGCYGKILRIGRTSITINLEVWVKAAQSRIIEEMHMFKVTQAAFTYVAVNAEGKKQPVLRDTMSVL